MPERRLILGCLSTSCRSLQHNSAEGELIRSSSVKVIKSPLKSPKASLTGATLAAPRVCRTSNSSLVCQSPIRIHRALVPSPLHSFLNRPLQFMPESPASIAGFNSSKACGLRRKTILQSSSPQTNYQNNYQNIREFRQLFPAKPAKGGIVCSPAYQ